MGNFKKAVSDSQRGIEIFILPFYICVLIIFKFLKSIILYCFPFHYPLILRPLEFAYLPLRELKCFFKKELNTLYLMEDLSLKFFPFLTVLQYLITYFFLPIFWKSYEMWFSVDLNLIWILLYFYFSISHCTIIYIIVCTCLLTLEVVFILSAA